ncbi:MAG: cell wall hydrolase [Sphingosinicella sp.]|uniref:cell wall hydrolase n=1 Tax=Sphingosinicella sp. TaxID=1917971 RepID=UPI0040378E31
MTADALTLPTLRLPEAVRAYWRAALVGALMLALFAATLAGIALRDPASDAVFAREAAETAQVSQLRRQAIQMSATQIRPVAPTDALAINAAIPIANLANPAARPFRLAGGEAERARALDCLTAAIYYEAATEPTEGQRAVAQVVLNRVRHPAYPASVCGVVFEGARRSTGCQFSFSCDGSLRRAPMAPFWQRARAVAEAALGGYVHAPAGWATHYHANYVVPYWASSLVKTATVGAHIFYRWRGGWGRPTAFLNRYAGAEPAIAWRGGFGQPTAQERMLAAAEANARDALAAAAAEGAAPIHSVDSFQRAVLRRYEPLRRDTANALIAERTRADSSMTNSQRWALTGNDDEAETPQQRPLGRWAPPSDTQSQTQTPPPAAAGGAPPSPMNV